MGRCNECSSCKLVIAERRKQKGRNRKKLKSFEVANTCENPTSSAKRRRYTEVKLLSAGGHGGETRRELKTDVDEQPLQRKSRLSRPTGSLKEEDWFDQVEFDEYERLVICCGEIARTTDNAHVKAEAPSMLTKMRALLDPRI